MTERHASVLELDRLAERGDLPPDGHVATCDRCRATLADMIEHRRVFAREVLPRRLPRIEQALQPRRWTWLPPLVLAAASAAAIVLVLPHRAPRPEIGVKGEATLQVFVMRDGLVSQLRDGEQLQRGDSLRFEVQPGNESFLLIASVDSEGGVVVIYPAGGVASGAIAPESRFVLPGSIVLDAAHGPERAFALLSQMPLPVDSVKAALAAIAGRGPDAIRRTTSLPGLEASAQLSIEWEKGAAPR